MFMKTYQLPKRSDERPVHIANEMQRVPHSYAFIAKEWADHTTAAENSSGHTAFAHSQAAIWRHRARSAQSTLNDLLEKHPPPEELPLRELLLCPAFTYDQ